MVSAPPTTAYRELPPPPALAPYLDCLWVSHTPPRGSARRPRVLPDGCIDIVWVGGSEPRIAGPATRTEFPNLPPDAPVAAARFKPGMAPCLLGWPANELRDQSVPLADVWSSGAMTLLRAASDATTARDRLAALESALLRRLADAGDPDPIVRQSVASLKRDANLRVRDLGEQLGLSERQLRRRFEANVGYGPKMFARIFRMRAALKLIRAADPNDLDLALVAYAAGYADQAHMTRELTALAGAPPTRLPELSR